MRSTTKILSALTLGLALMVTTGCQDEHSEMPADSPTFGDDVAFLEAHTSLAVLADQSGRAKVAVSPAMQGRVLTSTAGGDAGLSFGWINRELIASGERQPHINVFGGEDRFWLGPEGGQFSVYFAPGAEFTLDDWYVPAEIDWDPFDVVSQSTSQIRLQKDMELTNYSGTVLSLAVDRTVQLVHTDTLAADLGVAVSGLDVVAFESLNSIANTGEEAWTEETGLLSIWILGMFTPTPATTVVIPYVDGEEEVLGQVVNSDYFGEVPSDRLVVTDRAVFFSGDGLYRSKIGLSWARSTPFLGSYDADNQVLTVVQFNRPPSSQPYVNSKWELQDAPYEGDAINSYNDGAPAPDVPPLGPFYELETSSPAAALDPGASITHVHRTIHLQGDIDLLDGVARHVLGYGLEEIVAVFGQ